MSYFFKENSHFIVCRNESVKHIPSYFFYPRCLKVPGYLNTLLLDCDINIIAPRNLHIQISIARQNKFKYLLEVTGDMIQCYSNWKIFIWDHFVICTRIKRQFIFNNTLYAQRIACINLLDCSIKSCPLLYNSLKSFEHP